MTWLNLDADVIRRWMAAQVERGENTRTMGKELSALRSFYKYLRRVGRIDYSPVIGIHNPKAQKPLPTFLKEAEVNKLFDHTIFRMIIAASVLTQFYLLLPYRYTYVRTYWFECGGFESEAART